LATACGVAEEVRPTITSRLEKAEVQVAEPFALIIDVVAPRGASVKFPQVESRLGELEVVSHHDQFDIPHAQQPDRRTWSRKMELESVVTGDVPIPSLEISILLPSGETQTLSSDKLRVRVVSVWEAIGQKMNFRDIKGTLEVDTPSERQTPWLAAAIATGLAIVTIAVIAYRNSIRPRPIAPDAWALKELAKVKSRILPESDSVACKQAIQHIDLVLKTTISSVAGIPAGQFSNLEIAEALRSMLVSLAIRDQNSEPLSRETADLITRLEKLLVHHEQAKFDNGQLTPAVVYSACDQCAQWTRQFCEQMSILRPPLVDFRREDN
jgi:hypothetical protein